MQKDNGAQRENDCQSTDGADDAGAEKASGGVLIPGSVNKAPSNNSNRSGWRCNIVALCSGGCSYV